MSREDILRAGAKIIHGEAQGWVETAITDYISEMAPETTPAPGDVNVRIAPMEFHRVMAKILSNETHVGEEALTDYRVDLIVYLTIYLKSEGIDAEEFSPFSELSSYFRKEVAKNLKEIESFSWQNKAISDDERVNGRAHRTYELVTVEFFPQADILASDIEEKLGEAVGTSELEKYPELRDAIKKFPVEFNRMVGKRRKIKIGGRETETRTGKISFISTLCHELTHNYSHRNVDSSDWDEEVMEAFAWFTGNWVKRERFDKDVSLGPSSDSTSYENPDQITYLEKFIYEKAEEKKQEDVDFSPIDWANQVQNEILRSEVESKALLLKRFMPEDIANRLEEFSKIAGEVSTLLEELEEEKHKLRRKNDPRNNSKVKKAEERFLSEIVSVESDLKDLGDSLDGFSDSLVEAAVENNLSKVKLRRMVDGEISILSKKTGEALHELEDIEQKLKSRYRAGPDPDQTLIKIESYDQGMELLRDLENSRKRLKEIGKDLESMEY